MPGRPENTAVKKVPTETCFQAENSLVLSQGAVLDVRGISNCGDKKPNIFFIDLSLILLLFKELEIPDKIDMDMSYPARHTLVV